MFQLPFEELRESAFSGLRMKRLKLNGNRIQEIGVNALGGIQGKCDPDVSHKPILGTGYLSLYSTRTQNYWRWILLRRLTQKIVLLRYLTQKIPTCWYLWR